MASKTMSMRIPKICDNPVVIAMIPDEALEVNTAACAPLQSILMTNAA
jgi:hypothetical protein